jgi:hypothetical protein
MKPKRPGREPGPLHYAGDIETKGGFRSYLIEFVHEWPGGVREHPGRDYSPWPR